MKTRDSEEGKYNSMIETKHLLLRPFDCNDLDIILGIYSDEEIMKYMPGPVMDAEMAQNQLEKMWQAGRPCRRSVMRWQLSARIPTKK